VKTLTKAQQRAKALLGVGPLHRCRDGWKTAGGQFVALIVVKKLRVAGLAKLSTDRRSVHPV
jgi:hypothetical protein